jgi:hypothetical protein
LFWWIGPNLARWQSGYAAACKAVYVGSIPARASNQHPFGPDHPIPQIVHFAGYWQSMWAGAFSVRKLLVREAGIEPARCLSARGRF